MRINKYVALATGQARRKVDELINQGLVLVNNKPALIGQQISVDDVILVSGVEVKLLAPAIMALNKPIGYVCSRDGQGSKTIYDLLPKKYHTLKPAGRLDKDSSGLLLLSNDGNIIQSLTHPRFNKQKKYLVSVKPNLTLKDKLKIEKGVILTDGLSKLHLELSKKLWVVTMSEGRNRQIRRTFASLNYKVTKLHRVKFGEYELKNLPIGAYKILVNNKEH